MSANRSFVARWFLVEDGKAEKESMLDAWATTTTQPAEAPGGAAVEQLPIGGHSKSVSVHELDRNASCRLKNRRAVEVVNKLAANATRLARPKHTAAYPQHIRPNS